MRRAPLERPSLVVFDLDGTLVDTLSAITAAANHLRGRAGLPALSPEEAACLMGGTTQRFVASVAGVDDDADPSLDEVMAAYGAALGRASRLGVPVYDGARESLTLLRRHGVASAVLSNKSGPLVRTTLRDAGLDADFDPSHVLGSGEGYPPKPDPSGLRVLAKRCGVRAEAVWMVGDADVDVEVARVASATAIAAGWGYGHAAVAGADVTLQRPSELLRLLVRTLG